jgi:hypothetical protein
MTPQTANDGVAGSVIDDDLGVALGYDVPGGRLYRYRRFDAKELQLLIVAGQIRFADASYFNDPWDCRPRILAEQPKDAADRERIIEEFKTTSAKVNPGMTTSVIDRAAEIFRSDPAAQQRFYDDRMRDFLPQLRRRYPVLCLSASASVALMWSHYASGHHGVCLIFNARTGEMGAACKVEYAHDYPAITMPSEPERDVLVKTMLTKPDDWQYETEYRLLAREHREGDDTEWSPIARNGIVTLSDDAFVGLILGASMDDAQARSARDLMRAASRPLELWRAELHSDRYELKFHREL